MHSNTKRRNVDVLIVMLEIASDNDARFVLVEVCVGKILRFERNLHKESSLTNSAGFLCMSVINKGSNVVHDRVVNHLVSVRTLKFLSSNVMNEFIEIRSYSIDEEISGEGRRRWLMERTTRLVGMMG